MSKDQENKVLSIEEGNFKIAKFYGFTYPDMESKVWKLSVDIHNYHEDWNKLMDVVEKIESLNFQVDIYWNNCDIYAADKLQPDSFCNNITPSYGGESKISAVWHSVISFLQWYQLQQSK